MIPEWFRRAVPPADSSAAAPCIVAFGKHPAWDDHLNEEDPWPGCLRELKDWLYVRGISGCIDRGDWDPATLGTAPSAFNHIIIWQRHAESVAAILWTSADAKGRDQYPMVVAASVPRTTPRDAERAASHRSHESVLQIALRHLARLRETCLTLRDPLPVLEAVRAASREFAAQVSVPPRTPTPVVLPSRQVAGLSQILRGLTAGADVISRVAAHAARERSRARGVSGTVHQSTAIHLRVPALARVGLGESGPAWVAVLRVLVEEGEPPTEAVSIEAPDQRVVDLLFGRPRPEHAALLGMPRSVEPTCDCVPAQEADESVQRAVRHLLEGTGPA